MEDLDRTELIKLAMRQRGGGAPAEKELSCSMGAEVSDSWRRKKTRLRTKRLAHKVRSLRKALQASGMHAAELQRKLAQVKSHVVNLEHDLKQSRANAEQAMTMMLAGAEEEEEEEEEGGRGLTGAAAEGTSPPPVPVAYTATVAVVDDQMMLQRMTANMLHRLGVDHVVFSDGSEIVAAYEAGDRFQVILMDRAMTDVGGEEATRAIRAMGVGSEITAIVGLTGDDAQSDLDTFMAAGLDAVRSKPLHPVDWEPLAERFITSALRE